MPDIPDKLEELLDDFASISDRTERQEYLIEIADRFPDVRVPPDIASKPYPEDHRVPACESEAFVWAKEQPDGTLKYFFDVLNPQGLSAMAMSVILDETLSGQPLEEVASISPEMVFTLFGREISMGKGQGLMSIVQMVRHEAKKRLAS